MLGIRISARAAALASTVALVGGLGVTTAPALAAGDHTVVVTVSTAAPGWSADLLCTPAAGGAPVQRHASMTPQVTLGSQNGLPVLITFQMVSFTAVPDSVCDVEAVSTSLVTSLASGSDHPVGQPESALAMGCAVTPLTGAPRLGQPVVATVPSFTGGVVDPTSLSYRWYRSGVTAPVATSTTPTYAPTPADAGHAISVVTSGRLLGLAGIALLPPSVGVVTCAPASSGTVAGPAPASAPSVKGRPIVGHTVTAKPGPAPAGATIAGYQWYVKRVVRHDARTRHTVLRPIKGAHHPSLRMKERLAGKHVLVGVTYAFADGTQVTVYSKPLKVMKERMKE